MMRRGIKKVEMVDAWTQTSNHGSDTEDAKRQRAFRSQPAQIAPNAPHSHQRVSSIPANFG